MVFRAVGMLVFDRDGWKLVKHPAFAVVTCICAQVERQIIARRAQMHTGQELVTDGVKSVLALGSPFKFGLTAAGQFCESLCEMYKVVKVLARDLKQA
jgi:hypothetical protein